MQQSLAHFLYPNAILIVSEIHQEMFRIYPGDRPGTSCLYQTYALYNDSAFADDEEFSTMMYDAIRVALAEEDAPMASSLLEPPRAKIMEPPHVSTVKRTSDNLADLADRCDGRVIGNVGGNVLRLVGGERRGHRFD